MNKLWGMLYRPPIWLSMAAKAKPVGRPKTQINLEEATKLGRLMCTLEECSAWFGIPLSTLSTHKEFSEAYKKGKEQGKISLRRQQWELSKTNVTMSIWLGKQYLGQRDNIEIETEKKPITVILRPKKEADDSE